MNIASTSRASWLRMYALAVAMIIVASTSFATNGYFRHGIGIQQSALGGAGAALSLSSIGPATNPASLSFIGTRYDISVAVFGPNRDYTVTGNPSGFPGTFGLAPGKMESKSNAFIIPTLGASWKIDDMNAVGLALYANGGMNTNYDTRTFYDPSSPGTGVNLEQAFVGGSYAIQLVPDHALGVTLLLGFQRFAAKGLGSFAPFSSSPQNLTGNRFSTSTGFGARFGYQGKISPYLAAGASFQTKLSMGEFEEYKGLFAQNGDFDVPASWTAGIAVMPDKMWTFAFDVQQILYSGIKSVSNPLKPLELAPAFPDGRGGFIPNPNFKPLGSDGGSGFGWKDILVFKLGVMYKSSDEWTWMAGYSYGQKPIPESEVLFNILAPAVVQHHIAAGVSKLVGDHNEITLAFMFAPATSVTGPNPLEAPGQQTIKLNMSQWQAEIGYAFH